MAIPLVQFKGQADRPLRKAARRLRWFRSTFAEQVNATAAATGVSFRIDNTALAACFIDWLRAFEAQKPATATGRRAYVGFAAGLMLERLIRFRPLEVVSVPEGADAGDPAYFWPEGHAYVAYCLNVRAAVLAQDFNEQFDIAPAMREIRVWWSFKETSAEDPAMAIAFLDFFAGQLPNWSSPAVFDAGSIGRLSQEG